ncbi:hypothetical protein ACMD2_04824 [Ananas comosus]|uniref:Uncharacterized protein n=1 Tax=Ananas comosus TaxID=4615 RepID=A0A199V1S1_ANACO|nr:hypothetical protein ACMD2_04824 [Ananas comosus]
MEVYYVFMNFDPEYNRLRADGSKKGNETLYAYLSNKHNRLLAELLRPNTYKKISSLAIIDAFAASVLRSSKEVRLVEKNQEIA